MMTAEKDENSNHSNKAAGWSIIGRSFWNIGHVYIRESEQTLALFTKEIQPTDSVCIIGASGVALIQHVIKRGIKPIVIDFSQKMADDLLQEVDVNDCDIRIHDMIYDSPQKFAAQFNYVLTDQVINCFARDNVPRFFYNLSRMLRPKGELRTIIKIGFYEIDHRLIEHGKHLGTVDNFYDSHKQTIDYSRALEELHATVSDRGDVPKQILVDWYAGRGEESRFSQEDVNHSLVNAHIQDGCFDLITSEPIKSLTRAMYFKFRWLTRDEVSPS